MGTGGKDWREKSDVVKPGRPLDLRNVTDRLLPHTSCFFICEIRIGTCTARAVVKFICGKVSEVTLQRTTGDAIVTILMRQRGIPHPVHCKLF